MLLPKGILSVVFDRKLFCIYAHCILAKCENAIVGEFFKHQLQPEVTEIGVWRVDKMQAYLKKAVRNGIISILIK